MRRIYIDLLLWLLSVPTIFLKGLMAAYGYYRFLRMAARPSIPCSCGQAISLVGIWQCRCGFTYRGHLLRLCPTCWTIPYVARCYACGLTKKLPEVSLR